MEIIVFLAEGFEEIEALTPVDYLRRVGISVKTASCGKSLEVTGSHGISVMADTLAENLLEPVLKGQITVGVIIPGGMPGANNVAECSAAMKILNNTINSKGLVAAICAAPVVTLAKTGFLQNKRFTCYPGMELQMEKWCGNDWQQLTKDAKYTGNRVEIDGHLVTAAGSGTAEEFAITLVDILVGKEATKKLISGSLLRN